MDAAPDIFSDTTGTVYIAGEARHHIYKMCEALGKSRSEIRYNMDLRCFALQLRDDADKSVLKRLLSQNKRQKGPGSWRGEPRTRKNKRRSRANGK